MAAIIVIGVFIGSVLAAALSSLCVDEFKAWLPWAINFFIERAVASLPEDSRERYGEEWRSHVSEIPGAIGKLIAAVSLLWAARRMSPCLSGRRDIDTSRKEQRAWSVVMKVCTLALASLVAYIIVVPRTSQVRHVSAIISSPRVAMSVSVRVFPSTKAGAHG